MADISDKNMSSQNDGELLADLQAMLLKQERLRVERLEEQTIDLKNEIAILRQELQQQGETLVPKVASEMRALTQYAIENEPNEMAIALGPIIGDATRIQIRESRDEMVEVLYPIIGDSVIRAVGEAFREFQKAIDARLRASRGNLIENMGNRLKGVSDSQMMLRQALPFGIEQFFLIQRESGLLLAYLAANPDDAADSDLISGMLTAIRDFVQDSFDPELQKEGELSEISYGDETIVLQTGSEAYAAVVLSGYEPEGFRGRLRMLLSDLHVQHMVALKTYDGDPDGLPDLITPIDQFRIDELNGEHEETQQVKEQNPDLRKIRNIGMGFGAILLLMCCFYTWFTWSLLPIALGWSTPEPAATDVPTAIETPTTTSSMPLFPDEPALIEPSVINGHILNRRAPDLESGRYVDIPKNSYLELLETDLEWPEVPWFDVSVGLVRARVPAERGTVIQIVVDRREE